jgi:hypothetical protein
VRFHLRTTVGRVAVPGDQSANCENDTALRRTRVLANSLDSADRQRGSGSAAGAARLLFGGVIAGAALCAAVAAGAEPDAAAVARERNAAVVQEIFRRDTAAHGDKPDFLVLPGLLADRAAQRVTLQAETTALAAGDIAEFFLIAQNSGHDYEALAVSFAKPSDIHDALVFIGLQPGQPADPGRLRFWPKGEHVLMTFQTTNEGPERVSARVEDLVLDTDAGRTLPRAGLVFTGSSRHAGADTGGVYRADEYGPNAIASTYNEPDGVLDIPAEAQQSPVYGRRRVHAHARLFPSNSLIRVLLEPEYAIGKRRVVEASFLFTAGDTQEVACVRQGAAETESGARLSLNDFSGYLRSVAAGGQTPYLTVRFDDGLSLGTVRAVCALLTSLETEPGIRVEPPPPGTLCYRAFLPSEKFRDRAGRLAQPWELRLGRKQAAVTGVLTQIRQIWDDTSITPELEVTEHPVADGRELRAALDRLGPGLPVILVFAAPDLTHGELMAFLQPVLATHPTVHVFVEGR